MTHQEITTRKGSLFMIDQKCYSFNPDSHKNRLNIKFKHKPFTAADAKQFVEDQRKAFKHLQPGITILSDLSEGKMFSMEVGNIIAIAQKEAVEFGITRDARILSESALANMSIQKGDESSGLSKHLKYFSKHQEGEAWLDEVS